MRNIRSRGSMVGALAGLGLAAVVLPQPALGAKLVSYEACVLDRKSDAALMQLADDDSSFELDLRLIPGTPFALRPNDCVLVDGLDRDNEPGLRREYPGAGWLVEAYNIRASRGHENRSGAGNANEDSK